MPIAKITGPGLTAIGVSVALLWGCVIGEHNLAQRAYRERVRVMLDVQQLRRPAAEPVSTPSLPKIHRGHSSAG